jgi:hypothetical protein
LSTPARIVSYVAAGVIYRIRDRLINETGGNRAALVIRDGRLMRMGTGTRSDV